MTTHNPANTGEPVLPEIVPTHIHEKKASDVNVEALGDNTTDVQLDAAGRFLADMAAGLDGEYLVSAYTEEEARAVRRKADLIIVPLLFWALSMGAVDKVALGTAGVLNIRQDLGLVGQQFSWSSSLIFFGQLISVFPALFLMQRYQTGSVIAGNVILWGVISMCIAATQNFAGLAVCRFLLGFFESLTFPGFSLVISSWFTREEQVLRIALIFNTLSSATNGLLSYASSFVDPTTLARWRVLFLIVGGLTLIIGLVMLVYLPNSPMTAWWLTPRQRCIAVMRIQSNRTGVSNKQFKGYQLKEALTDPKTYLIFFCNVGLNIPNGGTATFSSIIINGLGFSVRETMLLQIPTGLISWVGSLILSYIAFKVKRRNIVAFIGAFVPLIGTIILKTVPRSNQAGSMIGLYIVYTYWGPYVLMNSQMIANTGGNTKKTITYGIAYMGYLVGNLIGPQTFKANQAPAYTGGFTAMMTGYCVSILTIGLYMLYTRWLMAKKVKQLDASAVAGAGQGAQDDMLSDWHDLTDFEDPKFEYRK